MQRFGEKLRELRQKRNLSIRELAFNLGVNAHSHIAKIETGHSKPSPELILKISRFFDIPIDTLMKDELDLNSE